MDRFGSRVRYISDTPVAKPGGICDAGAVTDHSETDPRQPRGVLPPLAIASLAAIMMAGSVLPWGTGRVLFISRTVSGFDLDGEISLAAGAAVVAGVLAYLLIGFSRMLLYPYTFAGGAVGVGVCAYQWTRLEDVIIVVGPFTVEITPETNPEIGLIMTLGAAAAIVALSLLFLVLALRSRGAG